MAARMSALRAGRFYTQQDSWYSFLLEAERPQSYGAAGKIMSGLPVTLTFSVRKSAELTPALITDLRDFPRSALPECRFVPRNELWPSISKSLYTLTC
jgi:hypothetical protein